MPYSVYKHTTPNGKVYIGITGKDDPKKRWLNGRAYFNNFHFSNAVKLYGWDNIKHEILLVGLTKEQAEQEEIKLISEYDSTNQDKGYNLTNGGECIGKHTDEFKRMASKRMKENIASGKRTPPMLGKRFSDESKEKMRKWHSQKKLSEAHKRHIGESVRGLCAGDKNPMAKSVVCVETGEVFGTITAAAESIGLRRQGICRQIRGLNKTAGGFHWKYLEPKSAGDASD